MSWQVKPHEATVELIKNAQHGNDAALEELVSSNAALVKSIVKRFINRGVEYDDLFQVGSIGLIKAIKNFNGDFNVRFSTYAVPMIIGEIKRFLRDDGMVKVSRTLKETAAKAVKAREELALTFSREVGVKDIAKYMGVDSEDIAMALEASRPHVSIYEKAYNDDSQTRIMDKIAQERDDISETVDKVLLKELLSSLEPRERQIIFMRYFYDKTQNEVAEALEISQVQVSRLESKILLKMRKKL